jgi:DNA-binding IclR family transcriptional regulator
MGTVTKALTLLTLFNQSRPLIGLSDFTRLSGQNKATTFRMLGELQTMGFVEQVGTTRAYRLGPEVLRLAALREASVPLVSVARETLEHLSATTGETAHMSQIRGHQLNTLAYAYGARHGTQVRMEDAEVLSFHATSSGLAVLGFSNPEFVDDILSRPLKAHTSETRTDPLQIRAGLEQVRKAGMAESVGGFEADVHSHATPVFGPDMLPIGALAVATPVSRMNEALKALIQAELQQGARALTHQIGGLYPPHFPLTDAA